MSDEVLNLYKEVALGGIGTIITGGFPAFQERVVNDSLDTNKFIYTDFHIEGIEKLPQVVHTSAPDCKVLAQLENGSLSAKPSSIDSPYSKRKYRALTIAEIVEIQNYYVTAIQEMKQAGFDGVQLHAAHGGLLSQFLSPYTNRRKDAYGGSTAHRVRIIQEIVSKARELVYDFPILIKMNCTDYIEDGTTIDTFPNLAHKVEQAGVDAIEVSGGMWDCLVRSEEELGFPPVPAPESHTRISNPKKQSYFLKYANKLNLKVPIILVGGNRDVDRLEKIIQEGRIDFIALSRPIICEPNLPTRWLEGRGKGTTDCISCNACIFSMYVHPGRSEPGIVTCVYKLNPSEYYLAQEWLSTWVDRNKVSRS
jgi:2,4-dienoyl-CoA reductase-like NADH-dependent reductase (Old Yellow Enzyme family)